MTLFFILTVLSADPILTPTKIPDNVRKYFDNAATLKTETITQLANKAADIEIAANGEPNRERKGALRQQLKQAKALVDQAKNAKPHAYLPNKPDKDNVGLLEPSTIKAVIDNNTAILITQNGMTVVLKTNTQGLFTDQPYNSPELWQAATDTYATLAFRRPDDIPEPLYLQIRKRLSSGGGCYFLTPIKAADARRYRELYDAEQAAKTKSPAKP